MRPTNRRVCILMACADASEADQVGRRIGQLKSGCLVTYRRAEDMLSNAPRSRVALVILATDETPTRLTGMLSWLRNRWPHCPLTVVGTEGGGSYELSARSGGALYLTRPVSDGEWDAMLSHVLTPRPERDASHEQTGPSSATL